MHKPRGPLTLLATSSKARRWAVAAVLLAAGCVYVQWRVRGYLADIRAAFTGETGPVRSRAGWPRPLLELLDEGVEGIEIDESVIPVYCLCRGFDDTFVWRMDAVPGLFEHLQERWKLTQVDDSRFYILEGAKSPHSAVRTPHWWQPHDDGHTTFYVSSQVLAGGKDDHFHVALDEKREKIWVYHWFNF